MSVFLPLNVAVQTVYDNFRQYVFSSWLSCVLYVCCIFLDCILSLLLSIVLPVLANELNHNRTIATGTRMPTVPFWDHAVLPAATRQRCRSRLYPSQLPLVLDLATPEGCKAEMTLYGYAV